MVRVLCERHTGFEIDKSASAGLTPALDTNHAAGFRHCRRQLSLRTKTAQRDFSARALKSLCQLIALLRDCGTLGATLIDPARMGKLGR